MFTIKISSEEAPKAIGPYSPAIQIGDFIYFSGQLPVNPKTNEIVSNDIEAQTRQSLANLKALLNEVGLDTRHIVKTTVFMSDLSEFDKMNNTYALFFNEPYPARSTVQVAALPKGAKIEIEALVIDTLKYEKPVNGGCSSCSGEYCDGDEDCEGF